MERNGEGASENGPDEDVEVVTGGEMCRECREDARFAFKCRFRGRGEGCARARFRDDGNDMSTNAIDGDREWMSNAAQQRRYTEM